MQCSEVYRTKPIAPVSSQILAKSVDRTSSKCFCSKPPLSAAVLKTTRSAPPARLVKRRSTRRRNASRILLCSIKLMIGYLPCLTYASVTMSASSLRHLRARLFCLQRCPMRDMKPMRRTRSVEQYIRSAGKHHTFLPIRGMGQNAPRDRLSYHPPDLTCWTCTRCSARSDDFRVCGQAQHVPMYGIAMHLGRVISFTLSMPIISTQV